MREGWVNLRSWRPAETSWRRDLNPIWARSRESDTQVTVLRLLSSPHNSPFRPINRTLAGPESTLCRFDRWHNSVNPFTTGSPTSTRPHVYELVLGPYSIFDWMTGSQRYPLYWGFEGSRWQDRVASHHSLIRFLVSMDSHNIVHF